MGFDVVFALLFSAGALLWTIYRDKSGDTDDLIDRVTSLESTVSGHTTDIARLNVDHEDLEATIRVIQKQIHQLDLKIERIIVILEQQEKEKGR
ncbi:hypothetical protein [Enterobacter bugandensis]|uniref:hypothetical protein n=1 Tax=Enterobacter bugandensis TaxID=881260 RepID=UPI00200582A8|nr:hypothetical protein [Enterobacter bugandensis]MCK7131744.1 hypothetical protein [Enterobacter bugandensis]HDV6228931.1 hypothetical protein [Enterobacter hormaechei]